MRPATPQQHVSKERVHHNFTARIGENDDNERNRNSKCVQMAADSPNDGSARLLCGTIYARDDQSRDSFIHAFIHPSIHNHRSHS